MLNYLVIIFFVFIVSLAVFLVLGQRSAPKVFAPLIEPVLNASFFQLPELSYIKNRQGRLIAFRHYPVEHTQKVAILIHGAAMESRTMHGLARFLVANQFACFAPDVRGHGSTGSLGDIDYIGQLEDDLFDLIESIKRIYPQASINLIGFSAGGGFALRFCSSQYSSSVQRCLLLAPMLHHREFLRPKANNVWAKPFYLRLIALTAIRFFGLPFWQRLPVIAFGVPDQAPVRDKTSVIFTPRYSYRLQRNFRPERNWRQHFRKTKLALTVIIGREDELFSAERYEKEISSLNPCVQVRVLPHLGHVALCSDPIALNALLESMNTSVNYLISEKAESSRAIKA